LSQTNQEKMRAKLKLFFLYQERFKIGNPLNPLNLTKVKKPKKSALREQLISPQTEKEETQTQNKRWDLVLKTPGFLEVLVYFCFLSMKKMVYKQKTNPKIRKTDDSQKGINRSGMNRKGAVGNKFFTKIKTQNTFTRPLKQSCEVCATSQRSTLCKR
jgi:hypothetical protein